MVVKYIIFYTLAAASYLYIEVSLKVTAVNKNTEKGSIGNRHF